MFKRIISVVLVITILTILCMISINAVIKIRKGDVNGDGIITTCDYLKTKKYIGGIIDFTKEMFQAADVDSDGRITTTDCLKIKAHMSGVINLWESSAQKCKLIVNGEDISEGHHVSINDGYAEIPFVALTEALGAITERVDDEKVLISYQDTEFILNMEQGTLIDSYNPELDYFIAAPGSTGVRWTVIDGEFIIDNVTLSFVMSNIFNKYIHVYPSESVIYIVDKV